MHFFYLLVIGLIVFLLIRAFVPALKGKDENVGCLIFICLFIASIILATIYTFT